MPELPPPSWQPLDDAAAPLLPLALRPWMRLSGSMTAQLRLSMGGAVDVALLASGTGAFYPDESACFVDRPARGHVREVCLRGAGRTLLAARTVYAARKLVADPALAGLGSRPLGELLFDPASPARWSLREFARLLPGSAMRDLAQRCAPAADGDIWARRTLFWLEGEPLLVTEVFLPPVPVFVPGP